MKKQTRYIVFFAILAVLVGLFVWYKAAPGKYDALANCLKEKQVKFYGAFWCPHCQATKKAFGKSAELLPYIECSEKIADAQGNYAQTKTCTDANITGYPTWEFPNAITMTKTDTDGTVACKPVYSPEEPNSCEGAASGSWVTTIGGRQFLSPSKPSLDGAIWTLPPLSRTSGETPISLLSQLSTCPIK